VEIGCCNGVPPVSTLLPLAVWIDRGGCFDIRGDGGDWRDSAIQADINCVCSAVMPHAQR
jgi:hypothetical protein